MTWRYEQATGQLSHDGVDVAVGYAGAGEGKNNPDMQDVQCVGPIPRGRYSINAPMDTKTHGPYAMHLTPDPSNDMCGRSAFMIHGDSVVHPGTASEGCIIQARPVRQQIWNSGDHDLTVV